MHMADFAVAHIVNELLRNTARASRADHMPFTGEFLEFWQRNPSKKRSVKDLTVSRLNRHVRLPDTTQGKKRDFVLIRFERSVSALQVTEYTSVMSFSILRLTTAS